MPECDDEPMLVNAREIASLFGVTPQRVSQMRDRLPAPTYEYGGVRLWDRGEIIEWGRAHNYIEVY